MRDGGEGRGLLDFYPENSRDGVKPQGEAFHYASFCAILLWDVTRAGIGAVATALARGVRLRSRCGDGVPWPASVGRGTSIETVGAGGDRLQEVVGDKATALK